MKKKLVNILKYVLSFGLAGLLVWLAFKGIDWHEFLIGLKATRWGWIFLFLVAGYLAQLIHPLDNDIHYGKVWDANNIGGMVSIAIPGSGDLVRTALLTTAKLPYQTVFGTVIMERAWDVLAIVLMFAISLIFAWSRFGGFFVDNIWHPLTTHVIILWILGILILLIAGAGTAKASGAEVIFGTADKADKAAVLSCDILLLGSPAMGDEVLEDTMEEFFASIEKSIGSKKVAVFGSYDWGDGQWLRDWADRIKAAGAVLPQVGARFQSLENVRIARCPGCDLIGHHDP